MISFPLQWSQNYIYFVEMDFGFPHAIVFTSARWPVSPPPVGYLHIVEYDKNDYKAVVTVIFVKSGYTHIWFSNQIIFSEIEMWEKHFLNNKLIAGSIIFNLEKIKLILFKKRILCSLYVLIAYIHGSILPLF